MLSVGLSCQTGECRGAVRDATTDAQGEYAFTLEGHETQSEQVAVPALRLVDPGLGLDGDTDIVARWSTERPAPYELTFETDTSTPV